MTEKELLEKNISAICLGCDKNRVDLEHILGNLKDFGFNIVEDINDAQIIIVNTCAFISPAIKETIDNILLAVKLKTNKCEKVIVTGCINERYLNEVQNEIPEVDCFIKIKDNDTIISSIFDLYGVENRYKHRAPKRLLTTPSHYAYLKISDGCNNGCAFCTIPRIRGRYKSEPMEDLVKEAKELASNGVKELIIVAQDITRYGEDLYDKNMLIPLLDKLSKIKGIEWIRLHYAYPEKITKDFLDYVYENNKICKYLDIPLQHIDNNILFDMNRRCDEFATRKLIENIKTNYPKIALRTTYMVGFPGETTKQFKKLLNFISQNPMPNVGFFAFCKEEKTKAYFMKKQVPQFIKKHRLKVIQKAQEKIADNLNFQRIGQVVRVIIDGFDENSGYFVARDEFNSPDVDFYILVNDNSQIKIGNMYNVKLTNYIDRFFVGEVV